MIEDSDIVELLHVTIFDLYDLNARTVSEGFYEIRVGPIVINLTRDEIMEVKTDPKAFLDLIRDKIQERVKPV